MRHGKRKMAFGLFIVVMICVLSACGSSGESEKNNTKMHSEVSGSVSDSATETEVPEKERGDNKTEDDAPKSTKQNEITITAGDTVFTATLADNSSADALKELLAEGPLTIDMSDYGNMEKMGPIGKDLPTNDEEITTKAGDLILYQGNSLVIYYDENSWNFTRLGKIEGVTGEELLDAFGDGDVTVTFSLELCLSSIFNDII